MLTQSNVFLNRMDFIRSLTSDNRADMQIRLYKRSRLKGVRFLRISRIFSLFFKISNTVPGRHSQTFLIP
jgi:hypothetical protein